jgi:hypothetical protein
MAITNWTVCHISLLKKKPWIGKLKKQINATFRFVNNPKGIMMTVTEVMKSRRG